MTCRRHDDQRLIRTCVYDRCRTIGTHDIPALIGPIDQWVASMNELYPWQAIVWPSFANVWLQCLRDDDTQPCFLNSFFMIHTWNARATVGGSSRPTFPLFVFSVAISQSSSDTGRLFRGTPAHAYGIILVFRSSYRRQIWHTTLRSRT